MLLGKEAGMGVGNTETQLCERQVPSEGQEARPGRLLFPLLCGPSLRQPCLCLLVQGAGRDDQAHHRLLAARGAAWRKGWKAAPSPLSWSYPETRGVGGLALSSPQSLAVTNVVHLDFKGPARGSPGSGGEAPRCCPPWGWPAPAGCTALSRGSTCMCVSGP